MGRAKKSAEITLLFSGGLDSTSAAIFLAERYSKIHLVTYDHHYGLYFFGTTKKQARELIKRYPDKITFEMINTKKIHELIAVNHMAEDYKKYKSGFIWCMGCKIAMHTQTIIYNLEFGIPYASDGSAAEQDKLVEQMKESVREIEDYYAEYGIEHTTPVYDMTRDEKMQILKDHGLNLGMIIMGNYMSTQPRCVGGHLYYLPYGFLSDDYNHNENDVVRYIREKKAMGKKYIDDYFKRKGLDLADLILK